IKMVGSCWKYHLNAISLDSCFHDIAISNIIMFISELWLTMNMIMFEIAISWKHESYEQEYGLLQVSEDGLLRCF
ncbi:hypothetical protein L9F63_019570, partial [Diploptera punctata]